MQFLTGSLNRQIVVLTGTKEEFQSNFDNEVKFYTYKWRLSQITKTGIMPTNWNAFA